MRVRTQEEIAKSIAIRRPRETRSPYTSQGFTIVELLIAVVAVAILASITIVAYNGIQAGAVEATLRSDLSQAKTQLELDNRRNNSYPSNQSAANDGKGLPASPGTTFTYVRSGGEYCLSAQSPKSTTTYYLQSSSESVQVGNCAGFGVAPPPTITSTSLPAINRNTPYSRTIPFTGTPSPTLTVSAGTLPTGLALNSTTGVISGTPTVSGSFSFTVRAQNTNGSATRALSITVNKITTELLINGGFENNMTGWDERSSTSPMTINVITSGAQEGSRYVQGNRDFLQAVQVSPGEILNVKGWVRYDSDGGGVRDPIVTVVYYNASGTAMYASSWGYDFDTAATWTYFNQNTTVPASATTAKLEVWPGLGGTASYDGFSITTLR